MVKLQDTGSFKIIVAAIKGVCQEKTAYLDVHGYGGYDTIENIVSLYAKKRGGFADV